MFRAQLEPSFTPSPHNYETTALFVENIFDTVKKAKAAKAKASMSSPTFEYSFSETSPAKKRKTRKISKKNTKAQKTTPAKKKVNSRKSKTLSEVSKRKKEKTARTPRKYTKKATKVTSIVGLKGEPADIDDEEAAFILSSISQRSFTKFYSRLNGCNKIEIPISSDTNLFHDVVMLDHNYWMTSKVEAQTETVTKKEEVEVQETQIIASTSQFDEGEPKEVLNQEIKTPEVCENEVIPVINAQKEEKEVEVNNNKIQASPVEKRPRKKKVTKKLFAETSPVNKKLKLHKKVEKVERKVEEVEDLKNIDKIEKVEKLRKVENDNKKVEDLYAKIENRNTKTENENTKIENGNAKIENGSEKIKVKNTKIEVETEKAEIKIEAEIRLEKIDFEEKKCEKEIDQIVKTDFHVQETPLSPQIDLKIEEILAPIFNTQTFVNGKDEMKIEKSDFKTEKCDDDEDLERHNWEKVLEFHRTQLDKMIESNKRFERKENYSEQSPANRIPRFQSYFSRFHSSDYYQSHWKESNPFVSSANPFQRSKSETISADPRINSDMNYSSTNYQTSIWNNQNNNLERRTKLSRFSLEKPSTFDSAIQKSKSEDFYALNSITKPKVHVQESTACSKDPRLNPSLTQIQSKKEENETPKKKVIY